MVAAKYVTWGSGGVLLRGSQYLCVLVESGAVLCTCTIYFMMTNFREVYCSIDVETTVITLFERDKYTDEERNNKEKCNVSIISLWILDADLHNLFFFKIN